FVSRLCSLYLFFLLTRRPPRSTLFPCTTLFRSGWRVAVIDDLSNGSRDLVPDDVPFYQGSIAERVLVDSIIDQRQIGAIMHFARSEEHTSELQSRGHLVCRLLLEKKKKDINI